MTITFVLLAFNEQYDFHVSLGSLMCQTNPNWKAIVFHNGPNRNLQLQIERIFPDRRISYVETTENNGAGDINRDTAYKTLVDTEFTVSTSIQDFYLPNTVEEILKVAEGQDFIYWNSINQHVHDNHILDCEPKPRFIDWGNFAIRTDIAKGVEIPHLDDPMGDGHFVERAMKTELRSKKISKILTVHN